MIHENQIDIMAVCEYMADPNELILDEQVMGETLAVIDGISLAPGMNLFYSRSSIVHKKTFWEQDRYSIYRFKGTKEEFTLCVLHFPSKLYGDNAEDALDYSEEILNDITKAEKMVGDQRTLIIGDFNVDPYESPLLLARSFHSYQDKRDARKPKKINQRTTKLPFYNPMWNLYGDEQLPPGTYFYYKPGRQALWRLFDQAIMRYELTDYYQKGSLRIITETSKYKLSTREGRPKKNGFSDHFPIILSLGGL